MSHFSNSVDKCVKVLWLLWKYTGDNWIFCSLFFTWYVDLAKIWIKNPNSYIMLHSKRYFFSDVTTFLSISQLKWDLTVWVLFNTSAIFHQNWILKKNWNVKKYLVNQKIWCNQILTCAFIFIELIITFATFRLLRRNDHIRITTLQIH